MYRNFEIVKDEFRRFPGKEIKLPERATKNSAGYDFYNNGPDVLIYPKEEVKIYTDIKAKMGLDEVLNLYIRSSLAIKKGLQLKNNVGIVDSDYYNNTDNDGQIICCIVNTSDYEVVIKSGEKFVQGIFSKYLTVDGDCTNKKREGGIGSTSN